MISSEDMQKKYPDYSLKDIEEIRSFALSHPRKGGRLKAPPEELSHITKSTGEESPSILSRLGRGALDAVESIPSAASTLLGALNEAVTSKESIPNVVGELLSIPPRAAVSGNNLVADAIDYYHRGDPKYKGAPNRLNISPEQIEKFFGANPDSNLAKLTNMASLLFPTVGAENLAVKALPKIENALGRGLAKASTRAGVWAGAGAAQGQDPIESSGASLFSDTLGPLASLVSRFHPVNIALNESKVKTPEGNNYSHINTPDEASKILSSIGDNFSTSLGELSGSKKIKGIENIIRNLPFGFSDHALKGLSDTDSLSKSISDKLGENINTESIESGLLDALRKAKENKQNEISSLYSPINQALDNAGFELKERPNFDEKYSSFMDRSKKAKEEGFSRKKPSLTKEDYSFLSQFENIGKRNPITGLRTYPSIKTGRQQEILLKEAARDITDPARKDVKKLYNSLAAGLRKDISHNAVKQGFGDIVPELEKVNNTAKTQYYDLYHNPKMVKYLNGEGSQNALSILHNRELRPVVSQLDQNTKDNLFLSSMRSALRGGKDEGVGINSTSFANRAQKLSDKDQFAKSLLSEETKKSIDTLVKREALTRTSAAEKLNPPTGKMLLPFYKLLATAALPAAAASAGHMVGAGAILPAAGSFMAAKALTKSLINPKNLKRYADNNPIKANKVLLDNISRLLKQESINNG